MARLNTLFGAATFLLLQIATCDNIIPRLDDLSGSSDPDSGIIGRMHVRNGHANIIRDEGVTEWANIVPREDGLVPGEVPVVGDKKYIPSEGADRVAQLDGRALLAEWMQPHGLSKRDFVCMTPGWESCGDGYCCPQAALCCPNSVYCMRSNTDVCCGSLGVCRAGYSCHSLCVCVETGGTCCNNARYCTAGNKCCSLGGCAPEGGDCCSNGQICDTGNICVVNTLTGRYGCCTDVKCTAYMSSGARVPLTPTATPTVGNIVTTLPPIVTNKPVTLYEYYYWTITWYYYSYYFTYYAVIQASTLSSTYITQWTTISVYETGTAAAFVSLSSLSHSLVESVLTTPAAATTALALSTDVIGAPSTPTPTASSTTARSTTATVRVGGNANPGTGGASTGNIRASVPHGGLVWVLAAGAAACGFLMVWL